ncbi:exocyst complex component EXO70A1-like [Bidens hawaiensis]|uniref:exocyst complex component EXO70A1-like n=1 Tax=Bidens hawaiensis TaxID=980011 RepID=UPI0040490B12
MRRLMYEFCDIFQVKFKSREDSLSVSASSITFPGGFTHGSSSTNEVQEDVYVMSPIVINDLRSILKRASSCGYIQHFVEIYIRERKTIMQSRFLPFSFKIWSTYEIKKFEWGVLVPLIEVWIKSVKTSLERLFAREKHLCKKIFRGFGTDIEDICYEVMIQDYQIQVFNIIYALSFSNPPPDKIFLILDLFRTLDHFLKEVPLFPKSAVPFQATIHTQLFTVLSDKIIRSLSVFEMALLYHESSVIFVGPIDPLPRYVMSYLQQLCDHNRALKKLSLPKPPSIDENDLSLYSEELKGKSELSCHAIWIIIMVVTNLEGKAKLCEDGSAGHLFAMKNISYIVQNIEGHQALMEVVGDDYLGKLIQKFDNAKVNYLMLELRKIIQMRDYGAE